MPSGSAGSDLRLVVFTGGGIGDCVFHIPHFMALAARSAEGKIFLACKKGREIGSLFEGVSFIERVIGMADDQGESGKVDLFQAIAKFRALKVNEAWLFHDSATMLLASALAGVERRFGWTMRPSLFAPLLTRRIDGASIGGYPPLFQRAQALLEAMRVPIDPAARFAPAPAALKEAQGWLQGRRAIALGLNSSDPGKQWGGLKFGALAARLGRSSDACFLLFGAGDVAEEARIAIAASGLGEARFIDLTRLKPPLGLSFAALSQCGFYVGNDSSGLNLAACAGLTAIGLFGATLALRHTDRIHAIDSEMQGMGVIEVDRVAAACEAEIARLGWPAGR